MRKHGAEGEEELGQAQFAQLLQPVLQDLAEALAEKPVVIIQNIKVINGSKVKKVVQLHIFAVSYLFNSLLWVIIPLVFFIFLFSAKKFVPLKYI